MGSARSYRGWFHYGMKRRLIEEEEEEEERCEGRERQPTSTLPPTLSLQSSQTHSLCNSGCSLVGCGQAARGQAALVIDPHLLVKSLKMCPFPNRASETGGSDSKPALKLHIRSQQETQTCTVCTTLGPQGILGPESSCKRSIKSSKPQDGWGGGVWRHTSGVKIF